MIDFLMAEQHPIAVPPELLKQWRKEAPSYCFETAISREEWIATKAAQWGADQELDACDNWLNTVGYWALYSNVAKLRSTQFRAARRPKPPSLKEQALQSLGHLDKGAESQMDTTDAVDIIRRALESLPE